MIWFGPCILPLQPPVSNHPHHNFTLRNIKNIRFQFSSLSMNNFLPVGQIIANLENSPEYVLLLRGTAKSGAADFDPP